MEMNIAFDGLINILNSVKERIREHEDMVLENPKLQMQRKTKVKKNRIHQTWDNYRSCNTHIMGISEGKE